MNEYGNEMDKNTGFGFGTDRGDLYQVDAFLDDIGFVEFEGRRDED